MFGRLGFEGASTREIAKAANANLAAIVYHFGGKEALHLAVAEHVGERASSAKVGPTLAGMAADPAATATPEGARRARFAGWSSTFIDVLLGAAEAERWARFIVREQLQPTAAFDVIYSLPGRRGGTGDAPGRDHPRPARGRESACASSRMLGQIAGLPRRPDAGAPPHGMARHRRSPSATEIKRMVTAQHRRDPRRSAAMRRRIVILCLSC